MKKILVVEDDKFLANAYRVKLTKGNYEVKIANDGEEAIKEINIFKPDLMILDLVMPKKDCFFYATTERVTTNKEWKIVELRWCEMPFEIDELQRVRWPESGRKLAHWTRKSIF